MKKLVCYFSGWFEIPVEDVLLHDCETDEVRTAKQFLFARGSIDGLLLESFKNAFDKSTDGEMDQLDISIEEDENES